jgi:hypothetical protein
MASTGAMIVSASGGTRRPLPLLVRSLLLCVAAGPAPHHLPQHIDIRPLRRECLLMVVAITIDRVDQIGWSS